MTDHCQRKWQAEAMEDRRVSAEDAASFMRHAAVCDACADELRALTVLREAARRLPTQHSRALKRRQMRLALLQRADAWTVDRSRGSLGPMRRARSRTLMIAVVLCALTMFAPRLSLLRPARHESALAPPSFHMVASPGASWRSLERGATTRLVAGNGRFALHVNHLSVRQRFLLMLPDGELEVHGTRFDVYVEADHTRQVRVREGRVALRLRGQMPRLLRAGDAWSEPAKAHAAVRGAEGSPVITPTPQPNVSTPAAAHATVKSAMSARAARPRTAMKASTTLAATPAPRSVRGSFVAAMTAFSAGDYERAQLLFDAFERAHPEDARVEDALFLRAVAHAHRGELQASRRIAEAYLRRFPHGLRRVEAARLTTAPRP